MLRTSKQRSAILRVVRETKSHPTAEWVYEQVRKEIPSISLGTIYRNLNILRQEREISWLGSERSIGRYDGNVNDHYHLICEKCDNIFDMESSLNKTLDRMVSESRFKVTHHSLKFYGVCKKCQS